AQVALELRHGRNDTGGGVLHAQCILHTARQVFITEVGVVGSGQRAFEGAPVGRVVRVAGTHVEQIDPHRTDVGRLTDDLHHLLGDRVTDYTRRIPARVGCQPCIGGRAGG